MRISPNADDLRRALLEFRFGARRQKRILGIPRSIYKFLCDALSRLSLSRVGRAGFHTEFYSYPSCTTSVPAARRAAVFLFQALLLFHQRRIKSGDIAFGLIGKLSRGPCPPDGLTQFYTPSIFFLRDSKESVLPDFVSFHDFLIRLAETLSDRTSIVSRRPS